VARASEICIDGQPSLTHAALLQSAKSEAIMSKSDAQEQRHGLDSYGLSAETWMGMDEKPRPAALVATRGRSKTKRDNHRIRFKIMGHYNTGTHLIRELLVTAFGASADVADPNEVGFSDCTFWKHSPLRRVPEENIEPCNRSNVIGIAMVRNPLSWLQSLHGCPYDLNDCVQGEDWLVRSCTYPAGIVSLMPQLQGVSYANVEDIWNQWTEDYTFLRPQLFNRSMVLTYEEVVLNTHEILKQIASLANLRLPKHMQKVSQLMQNQAVPWAAETENQREIAAQKIKTSEFVNSFESTELDHMCTHLDSEAMRRYGYTYCNDPTST
jgi:hypothetical protein